MRIVLTYDVKSRDHTLIKTTCLLLGFTECVPMQSGRLLNLPNTTLLGEFESPDKALATFKAVVKAASPDAVLLNELGRSGLAVCSQHDRRSVDELGHRS